jgi:hypothetical protein
VKANSILDIFLLPGRILVALLNDEAERSRQTGEHEGKLKILNSMFLITLPSHNCG